MLACTILAFALLVFLNYELGGRTLLYPPVAFCAIWTFDLVLVWAVGNFFFPILPATLMFFLGGALAFSTGCWLATFVPVRRALGKAGAKPSSDRMVTLLVLLVIATVPFFFRWIYDLVSARDGVGRFLMVARMSIIDQMGKSVDLTLFGTAFQLSMVVALMAFYERERRPKRAIAAVAASFVMGMLLGQKDGPLSLVIMLVCVDWIRTRRLKLKVLTVMMFMFVMAAGTIELYVHLGGGSATEKLPSISQQFALYAAGGLVGFDRVVREPNVVPGINPIYVTYLRVLRRLGWHVEIPEVAEFASIGPDIQDNVYTMYWEYLFAGYPGALVLTAVISFALTLVYLKALQQSRIFILLYAVLFRGIAFGAFTDYFLRPYYLFEVLLLGWLVYSCRIPMTRAFSARSHRAVPAVAAWQ